jgi:hypothetical protein
VASWLGPQTDNCEESEAVSTEIRPTEGDSMWVTDDSQEVYEWLLAAS